MSTAGSPARDGAAVSAGAAPKRRPAPWGGSLEEKVPTPRQRAHLRVHLGPVVRVRRRERGWSQRVLAERAGVAERLVRSAETGDRRPTMRTLSALAAALLPGGKAVEVVALRICLERACVMPDGVDLVIRYRRRRRRSAEAERVEREATVLADARRESTAALLARLGLDVGGSDE